MACLVPGKLLESGGKCWKTRNLEKSWGNLSRFFFLIFSSGDFWKTRIIVGRSWISTQDKAKRSRFDTINDVVSENQCGRMPRRWLTVSLYYPLSFWGLPRIIVDFEAFKFLLRLVFIKSFRISGIMPDVPSKQTEPEFIPFIFIFFCICTKFDVLEA